MDAEYLKQNVGPVVAEGLTAVMLANPRDPVDYLADWLENYVATVEREEEETKTKVQQAMVDKDIDDKYEAAKAAQAAEAKATQDAEYSREQKLIDFLSESKDYEDIFEGFTRYIKPIVGASAVYISRVDGNYESMKYIAATDDHQFLIDQTVEAPGGEEQEEEAENAGVTFDLYAPKDDIEEEAEEENEENEDEFEGQPMLGLSDVEEDDEEAEIDYEQFENERRKQRAAEANTVFVPNVLMGPDASRIKFHRLPKAGSYFAYRCAYEGTLNDDSLDSAVTIEARLLEEEEEARLEREEAEEEERRLAEEERDEEDDEEEEELDEDGNPIVKVAQVEESEEEKAERLAREAVERDIQREKDLLSEVEKTPVEYALSLDTLGQNRRFTPTQIAKIKRFGAMLVDTLERIDRDLFKTERARRGRLLDLNDRIAEQEPEDVEDEKRAAIDRIVEDLESKEKPTEEEDLLFAWRKQHLLSMKATLLEFRQYNVFRGSLEILQAFFYLLDYSREDLEDSVGVPQWKKLRRLFDDQLLERIQQYEPREVPSRGGKDNPAEKYASVKSISAIIDNYDYEDVKSRNVVLAEILGYVDDSIAVKAKQQEEKRIAAELAEQLRLEEEERKREEEEEAARLAAEEAERLAEEEAERLALEAEEADENGEDPQE